MRRNNFLLLLVLLMITLASCTGWTDRQQSRRTEGLVSEADTEVGFPNVHNFREKRLAKDIYEKRDQADYLTYTYVVNLDGEPVFLCKSVGYGLPYAVQFSNPENSVTGNPQPEPNALFMPDSLSATWVQCINPDGIPEPQYVEPQIMVFTYPLHNVDDSK